MPIAPFTIPDEPEILPRGEDWFGDILRQDPRFADAHSQYREEYEKFLKSRRPPQRGPGLMWEDRAGRMPWEMPPPRQMDDQGRAWREKPARPPGSWPYTLE